jgi:hypothetical protein
MNLHEIKKEITEMRDKAAQKVAKLRHAETDDEFNELHYHNGQSVALTQVLSWLEKLNQK